MKYKNLLDTLINKLTDREVKQLIDLLVEIDNAAYNEGYIESNVNVSEPYINYLTKTE
jgi:hypothetical protein